MIAGLPLDTWLLIVVAVVPALLLQIMAWMGHRRRRRNRAERPL